MEKNYKKLIPIVAAGVAAGIYGMVQGKGIFNKPRFHAQHNAVQRYLESRHIGAKYSHIEAVGNGWSTVITDAIGNQYLLYMTCTSDGVYVFHESAVEK